MQGVNVSETPTNASFYSSWECLTEQLSGGASSDKGFDRNPDTQTPDTLNSPDISKQTTATNSTPSSSTTAAAGDSAKQAVTAAKLNLKPMAAANITPACARAADNVSQNKPAGAEDSVAATGSSTKAPCSQAGHVKAHKLRRAASTSTYSTTTATTSSKMKPTPPGPQGEGPA